MQTSTSPQLAPVGYAGDSANITIFLKPGWQIIIQTLTKSLLFLLTLSSLYISVRATLKVLNLCHSESNENLKDVVHWIRGMWAIEPEDHIEIIMKRNNHRRLWFRIFSNLPFASFDQFAVVYRPHTNLDEGILNGEHIDLMFYKRAISDFRNEQATVLRCAVQYQEVKELVGCGPTISQITRVKLTRKGEPIESTREFLSMFEAECYFMPLDQLLAHYATHYPQYMPNSVTVGKFKAMYAIA